MWFSKCGANFTHLYTIGKTNFFPEFSVKLGKIWLLKISTIFFKILFSRVPRILFTVMNSTQIVLQIIPNTFYSKIKIHKAMALQSFQKNPKILFLRVSRVPLRVLNSTQTLKNEILGFYLKPLKCQFF